MSLRDENQSEAEGSYLLVLSDNRRFAIPADCVRRVVRHLALHPVAGGRAPLAGLAQYAGEPLAVLDLLSTTGGGEVQGGHEVTVVISRHDPAGRAFLGLAVGEALHVCAFSAGEIQADNRGVVTGIVRTDDGDIEIVDPLRIGSSAPTGDGGPARSREMDGGQ